MANSYVHVVKEGLQSVNGEADTTSALVLDDECCNSKYLDHALFGRVKEFASLANLKMVLKNEGFDNITIKRIASKWGTLIHVDGQEEDCFHMKRMCLITKVGRNIVESFKIVFHRKIFWIHGKEVPGWVPDFMDDSDEEYDTNGDTKTRGSLGEVFSNCGDVSDVEEVSETKFEDGLDAPNMEENKSDNKGNKSNNSLKYPSGITPVNESEVNEKKDDESKKDSGDCSQRNLEEEENLGTKEKCLNKNLIANAVESVCSGHFKKSEAPQTGGSILNLVDELVKVGQTMGYNMEGCMKNMEEITESQGLKDVYRGVWLKNGKDLIISVYAPQELNEKKMLWDYLVYVINNWKGEVIIMGDFNEVRKKIDRFGLMFNVQGANLFNMFIANAGLEEFPLANSLDQYISDHRPILMRELKHLKVKIREWNKGKGKNASNRKLRIKEELAGLDEIIDKGEGSFEKRFDKPAEQRFHLDMNFARTLSSDQQADLEIKVSKEEIKISVWDCGTDKSPGLDGFTPTEEFEFYNGLKQSDPLSLFLFLLIMESLHNSFQRVVEAGMFKGVTLSSSLQISHMFYADDTVIVGQWNDVNIDIIHVLECFFYASGMRIDRSKSNVMGIAVKDDKVELAAFRIRCLMLKPSFSYLGSKVGGLMSRIQSWNEVVDRMESLKNQDIDILKCLKFKLGNGTHTDFWDEVWRGDIAFKNLYPRLYAWKRVLKKRTKSEPKPDKIKSNQKAWKSP
nr:RNA-directed DNA polymerase, eukaryota, reverse transcriptase zinc-binding domain protein [Tanacetum cinerariifolium]